MVNTKIMSFVLWTQTIPKIFLIDEIEFTEKDEDEDEDDAKIYFNCYLRRLANVWPSAVPDLLWWNEEEAEKEDSARINDWEFSSLISHWLKEDRFNNILLFSVQTLKNMKSGSEKDQNNENWKKAAWLWDLTLSRHPHPDLNKKEEYCYAVNLLERPNSQRSKKRKKGVEIPFSIVAC